MRAALDKEKKLYGKVAIVPSRLAAAEIDHFQFKGGEAAGSMFQDTMVPLVHATRWMAVRHA